MIQVTRHDKTGLVLSYNDFAEDDRDSIGAYVKEGLRNHEIHNIKIIKYPQHSHIKDTKETSGNQRLRRRSR